MKALLYCTKAKPYLIARPHLATKELVIEIKDDNKYKDIALNGFIVAECEIDQVTYNDLVFDCGFNKESQLSLQEMVEYVGDKNYYCLHLSKVKAFDEPKELSEYAYRTCGYGDCLGCIYFENAKCRTMEFPIKKAPQNMMRVFKNTHSERGYVDLSEVSKDYYILISIKPEWLCKILNGEKTIEVRKQILNCLKEMIKDGK